MFSKTGQVEKIVDHSQSQDMVQLKVIIGALGT